MNLRSSVVFAYHRKPGNTCGYVSNESATVVCRSCSFTSLVFPPGIRSKERVNAVNHALLDQEDRHFSLYKLPADIQKDTYFPRLVLPTGSY